MITDLERDIIAIVAAIVGGGATSIITRSEVARHRSIVEDRKELVEVVLPKLTADVRIHGRSLDSKSNSMHQVVEEWTLPVMTRVDRTTAIDRWQARQMFEALTEAGNDEDGRFRAELAVFRFRDAIQRRFQRIGIGRAFRCTAAAIARTRQYRSKSVGTALDPTCADGQSAT